MRGWRLLLKAGETAARLTYQPVRATLLTPAVRNSAYTTFAGRLFSAASPINAARLTLSPITTGLRVIPFSPVAPLTFSRYYTPTPIKLPEVTEGKFSDYTFIEEIGDGRHQVGLYKDKNTNEKWFLKEMGSTETQMANTKTTPAFFEFLARKEIFAGELARMVMTDRHVAETKYVYDKKNNKHYVASKKQKNFYSLDDINRAVYPNDLFNVNSKGKTIVNYQTGGHRITMEVTGRILTKLVRAILIREADFWSEETHLLEQRERNIGIVPAGKEALLYNIDFGCCFEADLEITPNELAFGRVESCLPSLNLSKLPIEKREVVRQDVIKSVAESLTPDLIKQLAEKVFGNNLSATELKLKNKTLQMALDSHNLFCEANRLIENHKQNEIAGAGISG